MGLFGLTRYQCLACGETFIFSEAKRLNSTCPKCLTPVDQREPVPVSRGGPRYLVRIHKVAPKFGGFLKSFEYVPVGLEKEKSALALAGWHLKKPYECYVAGDRNQRYYNICSAVYVRMGSNGSQPFALPVRKHRPGEKMYTKEEKLFRDAVLFAKEGLVIMNLRWRRPDYGWVDAEFAPVESL